MTLSGCKHGFGFQCVKWPCPPFVKAHSDEVIVFGPWPALSFSHSFPLPENRSSQWLHRDSPSASHPSPSQTGRDSESHTLNAFPRARNSRVVLPLAHVSFQLSLVPPSLFSLPLSPVGLSSYVPWASLFLWPPWLLNSGSTAEKTSERMWLCMQRGGRTHRTLCVLLHTTKVCVCVCLSHFKTIHKIDDALHAISISSVNMACNCHYHTSKTMKRWESTGEKIGGCRHYIFLFSVKACLIAVLFSITVKLISLRVYRENSAKQNIKALRHSVRKEL